MIGTMCQWKVSSLIYDFIFHSKTTSVYLLCWVLQYMCCYCKIPKTTFLHWHLKYLCLTILVSLQQINFQCYNKIIQTFGVTHTANTCKHKSKFARVHCKTCISMLLYLRTFAFDLTNLRTVLETNRTV